MIRMLHKKDVHAVMQIWFAANCQAHSFISKTYWEGNLDFVTACIAQSEVYVAVEQDEIVGFIGLEENAYIAGLFVAENYRSKGIGKQLLDFVKAKYNTLALNVYCDNQRAVAFYLREGFNIVSKQKDSETHFSEYRMEWIKN